MPEANNHLAPGVDQSDLEPANACPEGPRCWHFDALSDDGLEALVITFHDNYVLSPRYFRKHLEHAQERFPAVTFTYSVNGSIVLRAVNEFKPEDLSCTAAPVRCAIGKSSFLRTSADYGSGFVLDIDLLTARKCRLKAELEWLSIETAAADDVAGFRKVVVQRSDVSGRITRIGRHGNSQKMFHFRGSGYHEESWNRLDVSGISGRAHFVDSTSIFESTWSREIPEPNSRLIVVHEGQAAETKVTNVSRNFSRDRYGLSVPGRIMLSAHESPRVKIKPLQTVESGFFKKVMTSEITLMLGDRKPRKAIGLIQFTAPGRLKNGIFRWLSDLRIGKNGKPPLF